MAVKDFRCGLPTLLSFFVLLAVSQTSRAAPEYDENGSVMLKPLLGRDLGIHRRSAPNHYLQNRTSTLYHSGKGTCKFSPYIFFAKTVCVSNIISQPTANILANVTMDTGNNDMIISTDHFAEEIHTINCEPDLRKLTLTFDNDEVYDDSIDDWEWVNFNISRTFIMLVSGCPNQEEMIEPWIISNATYDDAHFTVRFAAEKKEWNELPNQYTIDFEPADHPADVAARLARRDPSIGGFFKSIGNDVVDKVTSVAAPVVSKVADTVTSVAAPVISKVADTIQEAQDKLGNGGDIDWTIPLTVPFPKDILQKTTQGGISFGVTCSDCGMKGGVDVKGHIKVQLSADDQIPEFWIDVSPKGLRADVLLELDISGTLDPKNPWTKEIPFPEVPLPGFGIKGIASLGPVLGLKAGITLSDIQGSTVIRSGLSFAVNDDAKTRLSLHKGTDGESSAWNPTLEQKDPELDSSISGTFEAYLEWDLGIEAAILKSSIPCKKALSKCTPIILTRDN
jgi:hypothetical protein